VASVAEAVPALQQMLTALAHWHQAHWPPPAGHTCEACDELAAAKERAKRILREVVPK